MNRQNQWLRAWRCFLAVATVLGLSTSTMGCGDVTGPDRLRSLTSWSELAQAAEQHGAPIVILVEQRNCGFCQALKRDLFRPLANEPEYRDRALFVSVLTDYDAPLLEKDGRQISGFDFAQTFHANTTPTILFLNSSEQEIQERIVGYVAEARYSTQLRQSIEQSIRAVEASR